MRIATTTGDFRHYCKTPAECVLAFEGTGFKYLDYSFYEEIYPGSPFLGDDWLRQVDEAAEAAAKSGMIFVQAHSPNYNPLSPSADHEAGMKATIRSIEACARLGIPNIVVHNGERKDILYPEGKETYFSLNRKFNEALFPIMEKTGVNVLIENSAYENMQGKYYFMTGSEMTEYLDRIGHPLLHAVWDTGHANMNGANQYKEITALGSHLKALHVQDNFGTYDEHIAPMMGTLDLDAVIQALLDIKYDGYFTFEASNILAAWNCWPHARMDTPGIRERKVAQVSLQVRQKAEDLLYEIGKYALSQYGCFEE